MSKYGIGPTEEKVRAVLESTGPTTPTEVRSFLGMVGLVHVLFPTLPPLQSLYERSPAREYPLYGAVSRNRRFMNCGIADASPVHVGLSAVLV